MAGIGGYKKGKKFTLRSGNKPTTFKLMGAADVDMHAAHSASGMDSPMQMAGCMEGDPNCPGNFKRKKKGTVVSRSLKKASDWIGGGITNVTENIREAKKKRKRKKKYLDHKGSHKTVRHL